MRTLIVTGGTDGIGRGLARHWLRGGGRVVAIGTSAAKGEALRSEAPDRVEFVRADLSGVAETRRVAAWLRDRHPTIDALVLGAFRYQPVRVVTAEGFEKTFSLYVISRHLLAEELHGPLAAAPRPVVVNLCGTGTHTGAVRWDDLQLTERYRALTATMQGARASDLLGVAFAAAHPGSPVRYVLYNPMFVDTGLAEPFRGPVRGLIRAAARVCGTPVEKAVPPIARLLDAPPDAPLTAFRAGRPLPVTGRAFDPRDAARLAAVLRDLTARVGP